MADAPQMEEASMDPHAECTQRLAEYEAKWKRAVADYQNREKDITREREEFAKYCTVDVIRDFLPIVDAVESGIRNQASGELSSLHRLCLDTLRRHGVEPVGAVGDRVDYLLHEVIESRMVEGKEAGSILEIIQVGYTMHGRLLRPARVIVST